MNWIFEKVFGGTELQWSFEDRIHLLWFE